MIINFTVNRDAAAAADQSYVDWVSTSGKYIVNVYQVSTEMTTGGSQYVRFDFQTKSKEFGNFRIFLTKKDGTRNFGADIMDAIQVICGVRTAEAKPGNVYIDPNNKDRKVTGYRIPALEKKELGVLVKCGADFGETYVNQDGETKPSYQLDLVCAFDPATERTANEIINNKEAASVKRRYDKLMRDIENCAADAPAQPVPVAKAPPAPQDAPVDAIDRLDEDLPF